MNVFLFEHFTAASDSPTNIRAEGMAMRDAAAADLVALPGVCPTILDASSSHAEPDKTLIEFARLSAEADVVWVIAPESDSLLSVYTELARHEGSALLNASPTVIEWASNKHRTAEMLADLGIQHPPSVAGEAAPRLPVIAKPVDGAGGAGVMQIDADARESLAGFDETLVRVERFCPGIPASVSILCGPPAPVMLCPTRQHFRDPDSYEWVRSSLLEVKGHIQRAHQLVAPLLPELTESLGWIGVDLVLGRKDDGSDDFVIEVNPRLTSSYLTLRSVSDQNLVEAMLAGLSLE